MLYGGGGCLRLEVLEQSARASVEAAGAFLESHRRLFEEGFVARVDLGRSQRALDAAQRELFSVLGERDEIELGEVRRRNEQRAEIAEQEASLHAAERAVSELEARLSTHESLAPVSGRVAEVKAAIESVLAAGAAVLSVRPATEALEALVYVPPAGGKPIVPGIEVLVSPSSTRKEEYGSIRGRVAEVAGFPASLQGMVAALQIQDLSEALSSEGPPCSSRVALSLKRVDSATGRAYTSLPLRPPGGTAAGRYSPREPETAPCFF